MKDVLICERCVNKHMCSVCFDYDRWSERESGTRMEAFKNMFDMPYVPKATSEWWAEPFEEKEGGTMTTVRERTLDSAKRIVSGERDRQYGNPEDNFRIIADLWTTYLSGNTDGIRFHLSPEDVAMMMALLKIARIRTGAFSEDSYIDLAGYAACGCECATPMDMEGE